MTAGVEKEYQVAHQVRTAELASRFGDEGGTEDCWAKDGGTDGVRSRKSYSSSRDRTILLGGVAMMMTMEARVLKTDGLRVKMDE